MLVAPATRKPQDAKRDRALKTAPTAEHRCLGCFGEFARGARGTRQGLLEPNALKGLPQIHGMMPFQPAETRAKLLPAGCQHSWKAYPPRPRRLRNEPGSALHRAECETDRAASKPNQRRSPSHMRYRLQVCEVRRLFALGATGPSELGSSSPGTQGLPSRSST